MSTKEELADYYITFNMVTEPLVEKWAKTGLLEGLVENGMAQNKMAMLLENQTRQIYADNDHRKGARTVEFEKHIVLPLVRLIFGPYMDRENVMAAPMPAFQIPIGGTLTAVAAFEQRIFFREIAALPNDSLDAEAEFCSVFNELATAKLQSVITMDGPVLIFMPFARPLLSKMVDQEGHAASGFSIRWYHEVPI